MLAKVPKKRTDGRSSFGSLIAYVSTHASALACSDALWSTDTAADEMTQVSLMNERVKDAVYHYILSWPGSEQPTDDQAFGAVSTTLGELNMVDHQWVAAVHRNTKNVHTHVAVNRVHPETFLSVYPKQDWIVLDRACRTLELKYNWKHDLGPNKIEFSDLTSPRIVRTDRDLSASQAATPSTKARDFSAWTGLENFQGWVAREPAAHLRHALAAPMTSWQSVHEALGRFNLEYRLKGSGAVVVDRDRSDSFHAKATHLGRFAARSRMEAQLGPYTAPRKSIERSYGQNSSTSATERLAVAGYKADKPNLEKAVGRSDGDALYARYLESRASLSSSSTQELRLARDRQRQSERTRLDGLRDQNRRSREEIRQLSGARERRLRYSQHAWTAASRRETLRRQIAEERSRLRVLDRDTRHPSWRDWLGEQASAGNDLAKQRLRGLRFRERPGIMFVRAAPEIGSVVGNATSKTVSFDRYRAVVDPRGLNFILESGVAFRDEGKRVAFYDTSEEVLRTGLLLCREKWGSALNATGFERSQIEIMAIGKELGITFVGLDTHRARSDMRTQPRKSDGHVDGELTRSESLRDSLQQLSRDVAKPVAICAGKLGARHTGRMVSVLADETTKQSIVVLDIGRELGLAYVDHNLANDCRGRIGEMVICKWATDATNLHQSWQFNRIECARAVPQLER